jgi:hypothetical protein
LILWGQVFLNYGPRDNFALFVDYGFVVGNNPFSYASLDIEFKAACKQSCDTDAVLLKKLNHLKEEGLWGYVFLGENAVGLIFKHLLIGSDYTIQSGEASWRLLMAVRLLELPVDVSQSWSDAIQKWTHVYIGLCVLIDDDNERMTRSTVTRLCQREKDKLCDRLGQV